MKYTKMKIVSRNWKTWNYEQKQRLYQWYVHIKAKVNKTVTANCLRWDLGFLEITSSDHLDDW